MNEQKEKIRGARDSFPPTKWSLVNIRHYLVLTLPFQTANVSYGIIILLIFGLQI